MPYSEKHDEGLGTVYERIILNNILKHIKTKYNITSVLEAPAYGMTGLDGINSVALALEGCAVTVVDWDDRRLENTRLLWTELKLGDKVSTKKCDDCSILPFEEDSFDLVWNFAALWHVKDGFKLLEEMCRVSSKVVFVCIPNTTQPGYLIRKTLAPDFFRKINERWINLSKIKSLLLKQGMNIVEEGIFDIPPWPDTGMPAKKILPNKNKWRWSIIDYYKGVDPQLEKKINKYALIEHAPLPQTLKLLWAHHRYVVALK